MIPNVKNSISKSGDFMEQKVKKIFLETSRDRRPYHMEHLKMRYKNQIYFTENIEDSDMVLCIGNPNANLENSSNVLLAKEMGIRISYFTDDLLPDWKINQELRKLEKVPEKYEELSFSGEGL